MSSELQLDVCHLNRWWRHLVNAYEAKMDAWRKSWQPTAEGMTEQVNCGLTACIYTLGSASGPTLGNEYGISFTFYT